MSVLSKREVWEDDEGCADRELVASLVNIFTAAFLCLSKFFVIDFMIMIYIYTSQFLWTTNDMRVLEYHPLSDDDRLFRQVNKSYAYKLILYLPTLWSLFISKGFFPLNNLLTEISQKIGTMHLNEGKGGATPTPRFQGRGRTFHIRLTNFLYCKMVGGDKGIFFFISMSPLTPFYFRSG